MKKIAQFLLDKSNNYHTAWHEEQFDFEDGVITVTGWIHEDWNVTQGDYWTPQIYEFISRTADMREIHISYADESEKLFTTDELFEIESEIDKL